MRLLLILKKHPAQRNGSVTLEWYALECIVARPLQWCRIALIDDIEFVFMNSITGSTLMHKTRCAMRCCFHDFLINENAHRQNECSRNAYTIHCVVDSSPPASDCFMFSAVIYVAAHIRHRHRHSHHWQSLSVNTSAALKMCHGWKRTRKSFSNAMKNQVNDYTLG